jgi:hypothetical protein
MCRGSNDAYISRTLARNWKVNIHEIFYRIEELSAMGVATASTDAKLQREHAVI